MELWNRWKVIAEKIGNFQFKVIFSILYYAIFTPVGLISRFKFDFLKTKSNPEWEATEDFSSTMKKTKRQ